MARGRRPTGPRLVEGLSGSPEAKERARVILETIAGTRSIPSACDELDVSEAHFHRLRERLLASAIESLEPKPLGRPAHHPREDPRLLELRRRCDELEFENRIGHVREEILVTMPHLIRRRGEKKDRS
ncbi:MAG: hypothetical protein AB7V46_07455 [Thermomicrobiales bacterium]